MREIEIKARLDDPTVVIQALQKQGLSLSPAVTQHDRVFGLPGVPGASENSEPWLRIRTETDEHGAAINYFTLKRSITGQLDSIEHEVLIGDEVELANIITELGFVPYSDISKTRQRVHIGAIEICVDRVDSLGDFIEGEMLTADDYDYDVAIAQLWELFTNLGISRNQEVTDGYDVLVNRLAGRT